MNVKEGKQMIKDTRYDEMMYKRCGASGLMLPAISLGIWHNFGDRDQYTNCKEMIFTAFNSGITHFDAANNYGPPPGSAETTLGRILKEELKNYRDEILISTKAGYTMWPGPYGDWGSRKYLMASLDQSLKRLGLEYVDIFYSHRRDPHTPLEETMGALADIVKQGKALYVGISRYSAEDTKKASKILKSMGIRPLIHQVRYSMLDREIENGVLEATTEEGMGSIAFCPLEQGLLTDKYINGAIPKGSRADKADTFLKKETITQDKLDKITALNECAKERGQTLAQMALAWVLREGAASSAIIGASRSEQIIENVKMLEHAGFTQEEIHKIDEILKA
ncbi:MAG: aldo/keto reductase [Clostridia bacterium]|jgi:L-glyceraldehyde 3-phosphate reductase|nr:aldo/keto reductase [Clostridia bacterium]